MNNNHTQKNDQHLVAYYARAISSNDEHTSLQQLPAGGWLREVSSRENWRTTTIIHRYRDRATPLPFP